MRQRIGKKTFEVYACDFETHNDNELIHDYNKNPKAVSTSLWLWYIINESSSYNDAGAYGFTIDSFFDRLKELSLPNTHIHRAGNIMLYDYNLSFEWSFMVYYIKSHGFTYKRDFEDSDVNVYNIVCTRSMSSVWQINLKLNKGKSIVCFRDLAKIMGGGSLRTLARSYNLETQKGDIDYLKNRRINYDMADYPYNYIDNNEIYVPTLEERIYCFKDVKIIMDILTHEKTVNDKIFWKSMSSASYSVAKGIEYAYPKAFKPLLNYRKRYPELDIKESEFLRDGYGGGISYVTPFYQYKEIKAGNKYFEYTADGIIHIDMHNAHPSAMYSKEFALLKGKYFEINKKLKLDTYKGFIYSNRISCVRICVSYSSVKVHSVIKLIGLSKAYQVTLTVWDFEILTMIRAYNDLEIEILDGYAYQKGKLPFANFFKNNYDIRKEAKRTGDAYEINHRKLLNNSFYGKLNEKGYNEYFLPIFDELGLITTKVYPNDDIRYMGKFTYLPVGTAVPAYTRCWLIDTALGYSSENPSEFADLWKYILYFDTDSIFFVDNPLTRKYIAQLPMKDDLCNWGIEEHSIKAEFACPKRYKLYDDEGNSIIHVAGFNISKEDNYDTVDIIRSERYINRSYRIKGGTLIAPQLKKISVDNKYMLLFNENYEG